MSMDVLGTSEVVVDIPKCPWCVPRDEALANRFPKKMDRAYDSYTDTQIALPSMHHHHRI